MARSSRLESGFQDGLIQRLKNMFPGCMVFKMDQIQVIIPGLWPTPAAV